MRAIVALTCQTTYFPGNDWLWKALYGPMEDMVTELPSLEALLDFDQKSLKSLYTGLYSGPLQRRRTKATTLRPQIAYLLQMQAQGIDIDHYHQTIIDKLGRLKGPKTNLGTGTRLVREWHGATHYVEVEDTYYHYRGKNYQSLSSIARLITGTRWSGPRFFGLKGTST